MKSLANKLIFYLMKVAEKYKHVNLKKKKYIKQ